MGSSCLEILEEGRTTESGTYFLDNDGIDTGTDPFEAYCDMETDGGGWTCATPQTAKLYIYLVSCHPFKNLEHQAIEVIVEIFPSQMFYIINTILLKKHGLHHNQV